MNSRIYFLLVMIVLAITSCDFEVKEKVTERYLDGKEKVIISYIGDTSHLVKYLEVYPSGNLAKEILYMEDGESRKSEKHLYDSGEVKQIGDYSDDHRVGVWKAFFSTGQLQSIRNYNKEGNEEGVAKLYKLENGHYFQFMSGFYRDGEKRGTWLFYNRDGDILKTIDH